MSQMKFHLRQNATQNAKIGTKDDVEPINGRAISLVPLDNQFGLMLGTRLISVCLQNQRTDQQSLVRKPSRDSNW